MLSRLIILFSLISLATFGQGGWKEFGKDLMGLAPQIQVNIPVAGSAQLGARNHIYFYNTSDRYAVWLVNGQVVGIIPPQMGRADLKSPIWWSGYSGWNTGQPVSTVFYMCASVSVNSEKELQKKTKRGRRAEPTSIGCEDPILAGGTTWMQNPWWWRQADTVFIRQTAERGFSMERRSF